MASDIKLNNTPLSDFGAILVAGGYAALMTPAALKDFVENNDPTKNGTDVIVPAVPVVKERDNITLTFLIQGSTAAEFESRRAAFVAELHKGAVVLEVPDLGGQFFHLLYSNTTQYDNFANACKLAVKFREPNPVNRTK